MTDGEGRQNYLDHERLRRWSRPQAAWVGWGFVAEQAGFADLCAELGVVFIGPSGGVMRKLGDKISSKRIAEAAGVPVAPWSGGPVETLEEARRHADTLGYPVVIKATAGGGGRGIRRVRGPEELEEKLASARSEALLAFGDSTVFIEKQVENARHVEVQIVGDGQGTTWALGVRDCSIQRRNQKVLEESPSPILTAAQDAALREAATRLGDAVGYQNAGTVEFLYDPTTASFAFMEVNARLQVEHPVTELTTGVDLVKLQLQIAAGARLEGDLPPSRGHAVEVRLTAEEPERDFAPAPGFVERFRLPSGPGVRVDTGVAEGDSVAPQFDSMIAKVLAYGADRQEALDRLSRALSATELLVRNGASNKGFLLGLLDHPDVRAGACDIGWLDRLTARGEHVPRRHAEIAVLEAAIQAFEAQDDVERRRFFRSASHGRPRAAEGFGHMVELGHRGTGYQAFVRRIGAEDYDVEIGGQTLEVRRVHLGDAGVRLGCDDRHFRAMSVAQGVDLVIEIEGIPHRITSEGGGVIRAIAPGVVVALRVGVGDRVEKGDRVAVVEAMKTEMSLVAPFSGTVSEVFTEANVQVDTGDPLVRVELDGSDEEVSDGAPQLAFQELACRPSRSAADRNLLVLRSMLLGYDADTAEINRTLVSQGSLTPDASSDDADVFRAEREALAIFADIAALFRRTPAEEEAAPSDTEYLHLYLSDPDARGAGLPAAFLGRIQRALAHYGIQSLDPSHALREALFRVFKSRHHQSTQLAPLQSILGRWLDHRDDLVAHADDAFRTELQHFVAVTEGRFPALNDLGREVRYRFFERAAFEAMLDAAYAEIEAKVAELVELPPEARAEGIEWLTACAQPLKSFFSSRLPDASEAARDVMLEVLTRRYYRRRTLRGLRRVDGRFLASTYDVDGRTQQLFTCHVELGGLEVALDAAAALVGAVPAVQGVKLDFYVFRADGVDPVDADTLRRWLDARDFGRPVDQAVFGISTAHEGLGAGNVAHFTFRSSEDGFVEDVTYRGLHPNMGERLQLWRLASHFDIERLPSAEEVYLFRAVARENPMDERLYALVEVRDLTPLHDDEGNLLSIPHVERQLDEALAAIRVFQASRPERQRLYWNRVRLFVWPPFTLSGEAMARLAHRLGPATRGLGLEMVEISARFPEDGELVERRIQITAEGSHGLVLTTTDPPTEPLMPLDRYTQKVVQLRRFGLTYPYALLDMLTPRRGESDFPRGEFVEHDLDEAGERLVPVERPYGRNTANIVAGLITHYTPEYPEGMTRVILLGDPSRAMGSLAEAECRRINAAMDLAAERRLPLEWIAVSGGAKIAMDSGTENMDWIADVLRKIIVFTQAGHELNVVVAGINVGAQPYWNAEATMLMHTKGILIQTAQGAMVLTGKRALDYSGGVSAEDNFGIGGYDQIMGPNGQAQYFAADLSEACRILLHHYAHSYVVPGERFPRRAPTTDPHDRDVCAYPHDGPEFDTLGEVFGDETNPMRKQPFDIRSVMRAVTDQDHEPLVRWHAMRDAETSVVWDAHVGGIPVCMLGLESRPLSRLGVLPADGPERWTAGTLFPRSSKKVARAINSASGNRPLVVLANLAGFDGSPESMRELQLEYGAEIGRAVVNFDGPIVFTVVSRYHGGAFVVFSGKLNDNMEIAALSGAHASVIGGAPAAAVVFAREVAQRTQTDPRVVALTALVRRAAGSEKVRLHGELTRLTRAVHSEKLGEVADEFDHIHSVERALEVGSVNRILPPRELRPYVIDALERGMRKAMGD
ncbi:MAG: carboxyl transferase domain-containing protein [Sandaracinaceae bacterium]